MDLKGKVAVITGASGGIGSKLAEALGKEGMELVLVAKSQKGKKSFYECDLSKKEETFKLVEKIKEKYEKIDLLVNCAGIGIYKSFEEETEEELEDSLAIGVKAPFILTKGLLPLLSKSDLSLVMNIGSGMGVIPTAGRSIYCTMKFALRGLTLSLGEEFKRTKPHFCLITLGSTLTSFGPMTLAEKKKEMEEGKAYFTPEWVAEKLTEVIKDEKRQIEYTLYPGDYGLGWWKAT